MFKVILALCMLRFIFARPELHSNTFNILFMSSFVVDILGELFSFLCNTSKIKSNKIIYSQCSFASYPGAHILSIFLYDFLMCSCIVQWKHFDYKTLVIKLIWLCLANLCRILLKYLPAIFCDHSLVRNFLGYGTVGFFFY